MSVEILWRSAKMLAIARRPRLRGARHRACEKVLRCSSTMFAPARLARLRGGRHRVSEKILRCNATMPAPAGLARQRGARNRGGCQTLRWLASVWMCSLWDLTPCSKLCGRCILVDTTNATFFTHAAGSRDYCFLVRQTVGHLGFDGFETLEFFLSPGRVG